MKADEFMQFKNWAVVGDVLNEQKYAYKIVKRFESHGGYNIAKVNPRDTTGKAHKSLDEVSSKIDVIDLCINPKNGIEIIKEAEKLGINKILIQPGAGSEEIMQYCSNSGITALDGCALVLLSYL